MNRGRGRCMTGAGFQNAPAAIFVSNARMEPIDLLKDESDDCDSENELWGDIISCLRDGEKHDIDGETNIVGNDNQINGNAICTTNDNHSDKDNENMKIGRKEQAVSSISEELTCPLCLDIIVEATTLVPCGHTVCLSCIPSALTVSCHSMKECPVCRDKFTQTFPCRVVNNIVETMIRAQEESSTCVTLKGFSADDIQAYRGRCDVIERSKRSKERFGNWNTTTANKRRCQLNMPGHDPSSVDGIIQRQPDFNQQIREPQHLYWNYHMTHDHTSPGVDSSNPNASNLNHNGSRAWTSESGSRQLLNFISTSAGSSADDAIYLD